MMSLFLPLPPFLSCEVSFLIPSPSLTLHSLRPNFPGQPLRTWPPDSSLCFDFFSFLSDFRAPSVLTSLLSPPLTGSRFGTQAVFCSLAASLEFHSATGFSSKSGSKWAFYKSSLKNTLRELHSWGHFSGVLATRLHALACTTADW